MAAVGQTHTITVRTPSSRVVDAEGRWSDVDTVTVVKGRVEVGTVQGGQDIIGGPRVSDGQTWSAQATVPFGTLVSQASRVTVSGSGVDGRPGPADGDWLVDTVQPTRLHLRLGLVRRENA